jgi:hypothetical protein
MKKISLLSVLALIGNCLQAQVDEKRIRAHITYLAADSLEGRAPGTKGEQLAIQYIEKAFVEYRLKPLGSKGFQQVFDYTERGHVHQKDGNGISRTGKNVLGFLDNQAEKTLVIGAHFDHLGHEDGRGSSLAADPKGQIHNGADDNASGVAGLLELARIYAGNKEKEKVNFLFMAFSAEEAGLIGSKYWLENPTLSLEKIPAMINMDMIGRLRDSSNSLIVGGVGTSPLWIPMLEKLNPGFVLKYDTSGMGPSDHASFYLKDKPVLHFFSGTHSDYHKPSDDVEKINFAGEVKILEYIVKVANHIAGLKEIPFTKTKSSERKAAAFKVTLGIMADYAFGGPGVKVDGVSPGKAAEKAGILAGDKVMKLGEHDCADIYKYMEALGKFSKGEKTIAEIRRGDAVLKKEVEF